MLVYKAGGGLRIHRLRLLRCNCYIVHRAGHALLIDTSVRWERARLLREIAAVGVTELDGLFLTHVHTDHVGSAAFIQQKFGCPAYAHPDGILALARGECEMPRGTNPATQMVSAAVGASRTLWKRFEPCDARPMEDMPLRGWFDMPGYLLETPGHTADSASLILPPGLGGSGAALVGDTMLPGGRDVFPPFGQDKQAILLSWEKLLGTGCGLFLPGHGSPIEANTLRGAEKLHTQEYLQNAMYIVKK